MASDPSQQVVFPTADATLPPATGLPGSGLPSASQIPPSPAPVLSSASKVLTRPGELPARPSLAAKLTALRLPTTSLPINAPAQFTRVVAKPAVSTPASRSQPATHWADLGLLGMAATGGIFCWRTRRLG